MNQVRRMELVNLAAAEMELADASQLPRIAEKTGISAEQVAEWQALLEAGDMSMITVVEGGVIARINISWPVKNETHATEKMPVISHPYVDPDRRDEGLIDSLLDECERQAYIKLGNPSGIVAEIRGRDVTSYWQECWRHGYEFDRGGVMVKYL